MEKITSLEDLKKLRELMQPKLELRDKSQHPEKMLQIKVAAGTCGIAAGCKRTMESFINILKEENIPAVVTQLGCLGHCDMEPTIEITKVGEKPIMIGQVTADKVRGIVERYIKNNEPVEGIIEG